MHNKILLLSYPRSGNSLFIYFLQNALNLPTFNDCIFMDAFQKNKPLSLNNANTIATNKSYLFKEHFIEYSKDIFNIKTDTLILILRNYKECIIRHNGTTIIKNNIKLKQHCLKYCEAINYYDSWTGNKLLVYYEDLIKNFKENFDKILPFVTINNLQYESLFSNFEENKQYCLKQYEILHGKGESRTKGMTAIHHSIKLTQIEKNKFDNIIKNNVKTHTCILRYFEK